MVKQNKVAGMRRDVPDYDDRTRSYRRDGPGRKAPRRDSGDGLKDVLETLYSEHQYLSSLLDTLEQESARLKPRRIPDYRLLLDIVDYLTHYPDHYHHPREDLLFTTMVDHDVEFAPLLARLEKEHRGLEASNHRLFNELTRVVSGQAVNRPELLRSIEHYIADYRRHMDFESRDIFPRARGTLTASDRIKLGAKTRYIDDPLFGGEVQYQYRRLGRNFKAKVETVSEELVVREFSAIESTIGRLSEIADRTGKLKSALVRLGRESWREQKNTIRNAQLADIPTLPLALLKNQIRQCREGIADIRGIMEGPDGSDVHPGRKG